MEKQCFYGEIRESRLLGTGSAPARSTIGHCRDRSSGRHGGECARTVASAPVSTCRREAPSGRQSRVEQCRRPDGRSVDCRRCTRCSSRCSTPLQSSPFPTEYFSRRCEARSWRCVLRLIVVGFCCRSSLFPTITTGFYSRMNTQNTRCSFPHPPPQSAGATSIPRSPRSTGRPAHTRPQRHRPTDDGDATDPTSRICSHVMSWSSSKAEDHVARSILTGRIHDGQRCSVRRVSAGITTSQRTGSTFSGKLSDIKVVMSDVFPTRATPHNPPPTLRSPTTMIRIVLDIPTNTSAN